MRRVANASAIGRPAERRDELIATDAVADIDNVNDRYRLRVAVTFPSKAIAAKVLSGAHVGSNKWRLKLAPAVAYPILFCGGKYSALKSALTNNTAHAGRPDQRSQATP